MSEPQYTTEDRAYACVHLTPADFSSDEVRRSWQARGYAVLPEHEGHPSGTWCGTCSTDREGDSS